MRIALRRPLIVENAATEIARLVARALSRDPDLASAPSLNVTLEAPIDDPDLAAHVAEERFMRRLDWQLDEILRAAHRPRSIRVACASGDSPALIIEPGSSRAEPARLAWGSGSYAIDGSKVLLAVGRGAVRKRYPGARNDIVLEDSLTFVSRDAFALRWDPGRGAWHLEVDELGRSAVQIERRGSVLIPQLGSIPLESGDVIALTGGTEGGDRLEIQFSDEKSGG